MKRFLTHPIERWELMLALVAFDAGRHIGSILFGT